MKKMFKSVVSLALVSVLLLSMSINAFAFHNEDNVGVLVWDNFDGIFETNKSKIGDDVLPDDEVPLGEPLNDFYFDVDNLEDELSEEEQWEIINNGHLLGVTPPPELPEDAALVVPAWSGDDYQSSNNKTHQFITAQAFNILKNDFGELSTIYRSFAKENGLMRIKQYSDWPDKKEIGFFPFVGHFYNPEDFGRSWDGNDTNTALTNFKRHYDDAIDYFYNKKITDAWESLGKAIHYASDAGAPHHAANLIAGLSDHVNYENWVDSAISGSTSFAYTATTANHATSSVMNDITGATYYEVVKNSTLDATINSLAMNARWYITDYRFNPPSILSSGFPSDIPDVYNTATRGTLPFIQKVIAALLFRFYSETHYTITTTITPPEGGKTSGHGIYPVHNAAMVIATANDGYVFDGWYEDKQCRGYLYICRNERTNNRSPIHIHSTTTATSSANTRSSHHNHIRITAGERHGHGRRDVCAWNKGQSESY